MSQIAITYKKPKDACLYFDHVIPLSLDPFLEEDLSPFDCVRDIIPPFLQTTPVVDGTKLNSNSDITSQIVGIDEQFMSLFEAHKNRGLYALTCNGDYSELPMLDFKVSLKESLILKRLEGTAALLVEDADDAPVEVDNDEYHNVLIKLTKLNLVDAESASWEHILEARRDPDFIRSMRLFRTMFSRDLANKSKHEVDDNIGVMLDIYNSKANQHGFKRKHVIASTLWSKEVIAGIAVGFGISKMTEVNNMIPVLVNVLSYLGKLGLEITKEKSSFTNEIKNMPISHIVKLKQMTE